MPLLLLPLLLLGGGAAAHDDISALLEFKKGIYDDPKTLVLGSWSPPVTMNSGGGADLPCPAGWHKVACDGGAVVGLALDGLGLAGEIKLATLASMCGLQNLSLADNVFSGRLPPAIGTMASLRYLDLSGNRFYNPVSSRLAELCSLVHLNLFHNSFSYGFPTDGIRRLQNLHRIDLGSNSLWGNVDDLLAELRNVEYVDLSSNAFTGPVEIGLQNLSSIGSTVKYLNLSNNQLDGAFFANESVSAFKNLEVLDLSNNRLNGKGSSHQLASCNEYNLRSHAIILRHHIATRVGQLLPSDVQISTLFSRTFHGLVDLGRPFYFCK